MRRPRPGPLSLLAFALYACDASSPPGAEVPAVRSCQVEQLFPIPTRLYIDLLLVVDESPAMAPYQEALSANLRIFGQVLENIEGGLPDVHIAIVSADPRHAGVFQTRAGCGLHEGESFISDVLDDATHMRVRNYDGAIADVISCLGTLGASGSATAAPLASMRAALDGSHTANAAFHDRRDALYVGILAAQDDCSGPSPPADPLACAAQGITCAGAAVTPGVPGTYVDCVPASGPDVDAIDPYETFLDGLADDPNLILVGVAAAPGRPFVVGDPPAIVSSCPADSHTGALPAVRLAAFAGRRPGGTLQSICASDWSGMLQRIAQSLGRIPYAPCLERVAHPDVFPDLAGLQPDCVVADVSYPGTEQETDEVIARCPMLDDATPDPAGVRPCWWVRAEPNICATFVSSGYWLEVERASGYRPPSGTYVDVRCVSCDQP